MATNPKGETCLHIAAKNGHSSCVVRLLSSRINTPGAATRLADLVFTEGMEEVKYMDLHNLAGMTALHVAALNGSAATVQAVMANGASVDAQITGSNLTPWLSRGSTALHIAAARGFHAVVDVLLAAQTPDSGKCMCTTAYRACCKYLCLWSNSCVCASVCSGSGNWHCPLAILPYSALCASASQSVIEPCAYPAACLSHVTAIYSLPSWKCAEQPKDIHFINCVEGICIEHAFAGLDLRRIRNHRGLKPFQLARANGHSSIARQLCDTHPRRAPRVRRHRDAEGGGGGGAAGGSRKATTPEALLTMLIQVCPVNART